MLHKKQTSSGSEQTERELCSWRGQGLAALAGGRGAGESSGRTGCPPILDKHPNLWAKLVGRTGGTLATGVCQARKCWALLLRQLCLPLILPPTESHLQPLCPVRKAVGVLGWEWGSVGVWAVLGAAG